ncbi:MAG TPA: DNA-deoxyinosine glycosylase [Clostridia bacterium]|nr:DNA-deoxyinosine glycosylase [Clostridia bacterium]
MAVKKDLNNRLAKKQVHPIPPLFDKDSEVLILGSFPSVKTRETGFFYGHSQNRFWKVLAGVFECPVPKTIEEKRRFLIDKKIAVWDVIKSCEIIGSSDSSIKNVVPNDLSLIIKNSNVEKIFVNGKTAEKYYLKYIAPKTSIQATVLPSTSPANATYSLERLIDSWMIIVSSQA